MKTSAVKLIIVLSLIAISTNLIFSQNISRNQLLQMYHKANTARNSGDFDTAITRYNEIISLIPQLSQPYLSIAEIYDAQSGDNEETMEKAVFYYRKFIDTELDDANTVKAMARLKQLEARLNLESFEEQLVEDEVRVESEYSQIAEEIRAELEAEAIALGLMKPKPVVAQAPSAPKKDVAEVVHTETDNDKKIKENEAPSVAAEEPTSKEAEVADATTLAQDKPVIAENTAPTPKETPTTIVSKKKYELLYPIDISATTNHPLAKEKKPISKDQLSGRWVSDIRLPNNREVWIFDIDTINGQLGIKINPASGIIKSYEWRECPEFTKTIFDELVLCGKSSIANDPVDIEVIKNVRSISDEATKSPSYNGVDVGCSFVLDIESNMSPHRAGVLKWLSKGLNTVMKGGGWDELTQLANEASAEMGDAQIRQRGNIDFYLSGTPHGGLSGKIRELIYAETADGGSIEKANRFYKVNLHKVSPDYVGNPMNTTLKKNENTLMMERSILDQTKLESETDLDAKYTLCLMLANGYGEEDYKANNKKLFKQMSLAAEAGNVDAAILLINYCFSKAVDVELSKGERKKNLEIANEWCSRIEATQSAAVKCARAKYAIDSAQDIDSALSFYREAAKIGDATALNLLGELIVTKMNKPEQAIEYFKKSAEKGNSTALYNLALLYRDGRGVDINATEYLKNLVAAYESGNLEAVNELASAYFNGYGVESNIEIGNAYTNLYSKRKAEIWKEIAK